MYIVINTEDEYFPYLESIKRYIRFTTAAFTSDINSAKTFSTVQEAELAVREASETHFEDNHIYRKLKIVSLRKLKLEKINEQ